MYLRRLASLFRKRTVATTFQFILAAVSVAAMSACGDGGSGGNSIEKINGIAVPPAPDATTNQATVFGVDSDANGIRDDIDRLLATDFGQNAAAHQAAVSFSRTLQAALADPTPSTAAQHIALIRCEQNLQKLADFQKITIAILDTPDRRGSYSKAFAGVLLSSRGCQ